MNMKRFTATLIAALLALSVALPACAVIPPPAEMNPAPTPAPNYPELKPNDRSNAVKNLKERLYDLGYLRSKKNLNTMFNESVETALAELLEANDLPAVTVISPDLHGFIYSSACKPKSDAVVTPTPNPTPIPLVYPINEPDYPPLTDDGFLKADDEYVLVDGEKGLWRYISPTLFIEIRRYSDQSKPLVWYETEVRTGEGETMHSLLTKTTRTRRRAVTIARTNQAVLAFSDDYYVAHDLGVVIRDGKLIRSKLIYSGSSRSFPVTDTLAVFPDGSMRADKRRTFTGKQFMEMGAIHVLNFGPVLVHEGELGELVQTNDYIYHREPRNAIGMLAPNHYVLLTVDGRTADSKGITLQWLARRMKDMGAVEALNLDGGLTSSLVFMGWQLNQVSNVQSNGKNGRSMTSMLSFGFSDLVPDKDEDIEF